jgi:hypothetical protein
VLSKLLNLDDASLDALEADGTIASALKNREDV